jgi:isopentenyl diphosphate isomerase/L-lactate dehydrogenase-like FMN-dependent dehydrogenase
VLRALELLRSETDRVMALIGCTRVADLNRNYLERSDSV